MEHRPIASSSIRSAGYDPQTMTLEVAFVNETIYQYFDVPEYIFQGLLSASSAGSFLNANIRNVYRYARL
ncbi:MAG TPA: KTSC domain-containing protein [Candidatus Angelobacter sp.]|jgi:hypothetical protein